MFIKDIAGHHVQLTDRFIKYRTEGYPDLDPELTVVMDQVDSGCGLVPIWSCFGHEGDENSNRTYIVFSVSNDSSIIKLYDDLVKMFSERYKSEYLNCIDLVRTHLVSPFVLDSDGLDQDVWYPTWTIECTLTDDRKPFLLECFLKALDTHNRSSDVVKYMRLDNISSYNTPLPGDGWHEFFRYFMFVVAVDGDTVTIIEPCDNEVDVSNFRTVSLHEYRKLVKGMYYKGSEPEIDDLKFPGDVIRNQGTAAKMLKVYLTNLNLTTTEDLKNE